MLGGGRHDHVEFQDRAEGFPAYPGSGEEASPGAGPKAKHGIFAGKIGRAFAPGVPAKSEKSSGFETGNQGIPFLFPIRALIGHFFRPLAPVLTSGGKVFGRLPDWRHRRIRRVLEGFLCSCPFRGVAFLVFFQIAQTVKALLEPTCSFVPFQGAIWIDDGARSVSVLFAGSTDNPSRRPASDLKDSKSFAPYAAYGVCGFDSRPRHLYVRRRKTPIFKSG